MKVTGNRIHKPIWLMMSALLVVSLSAQNLFGQNGAITGTVADAGTGDPMPGTMVVVDGTNTAQMAGTDGSFRINARQGQTLVFSFIGYETQRVTVGTATDYAIQMVTDAQAIEAVVVTTGYGGNVTKADALGAVSIVGADEIAKRSPTNIFDAMRGSLAGVRVTSNSGAPGESMSVRVRGITTFDDDGVSPLYVVDGFIVDDIANINPNDIETINVLKDAASAAVYGARAAAGVIMVTTKSGKPGKMKVTVQYDQRFGYIAKTLPQLNRLESNIVSNAIVSYNDDKQFDWFRDITDSVNLYHQTSQFHQDLITQVGRISSIDVSARGAGEEVRYAVSANYQSEKGIILTSRNRRATFRSKTDYTPKGGSVTLTNNVTLTYSDRDKVDDGSIYNNALRRHPQTWNTYPTDGAWVGTWGSYPNTGKRNPMAEIYERTDNTKRYQGNINQQVLVNILPELSFTGNAKANVYFEKQERYRSEWVNTTNINSFRQGNNALDLDDRFWQNYALEAYLNYNKKFKEDHSVAAMLGSSAEYTGLKSIASGGTFLAFNQLKVPQATGIQKTTTFGGSESTIASLFGRVSYDYKKRYMISAVLRYDGSSRFGSERRWGLFPSVQLGWRFADHLRELGNVADWLHDAKLRFSYGVTGNDRIGQYDAQSLYTGSINNGYNGGLGVVPGANPGNPTLHWEQTAEADWGLELRFLKGRFSLETDYYIQNTTGLLDDEQLPTELGYNSMRVNAGAVRNKGWEVTAMAVPIEKPDWDWTTTLTWSRNRNTVTELAGMEAGRIQDTYWWVEVGKAAGQFYGWKQLGVYAYDANNAYTADFSERLTPVFKRDEGGNVMFGSDKKPIVTHYLHGDGRTFEGTPSKMKIITVDAVGGDVIWEDVDGDGVITDDDKQVLGSGHPDWQMSWGNSVRWKNLSMSFQFYYSHGGLVYNALLHQMTSYGDNTSAPDPRGLRQGWRFQGHLTEWHVPGQNTNNGHNVQNNGRQLSSFYLEDGSFIRLQDVRLAYDFDEQLLSKIKLAQLQLYVFGTNLMTWTNYSGYDPEVGGSVLSPGRDSGRYPRQKTVGFGVTVGF